MWHHCFKLQMINQFTRIKEYMVTLSNIPETTVIDTVSHDSNKIIYVFSDYNLMDSDKVLTPIW